ATASSSSRRMRIRQTSWTSSCAPTSRSSSARRGGGSRGAVVKLSIRNLLAGLVIVIVLAVVLLRGDQLVELADTIRKGSVIPLVAALLTQLGKYFAQSFAYSYAFEAVDERMSPRETLPLVFGTFFMNTIAPSLNLAGTTLVV